MPASRAPGRSSNAPDNEGQFRERLDQYARETARRARVVGAWLHRRWQNSLQVRVAATTLVVTGVVVLIVGVFIVNQVGDGVLRAKRDAAIRQATVGFAFASANEVFSTADVHQPNDLVNAREALVDGADGRWHRGGAVHDRRRLVGRSQNLE